MAKSDDAPGETPGNTGSTVRRNRLAGATSPYLLQHAGNPVDWYPWGPEAFEKARRESKPIFLSIGYSACHWCHVMEEESFEDAATASLMNGYFVSIKVDREERPDLDEVYMTAVQMLTGSGGWPMSVWLTPDLKPFYGGTYFPKDNRYGRPSFTQVLTALGEAWKKDPDSLRGQAAKIHDEVARYMTGRHVSAGSGAAGAETVGADDVARVVAEMGGGFDHVNGGFGSAPKFPPHRGLVLMLSRYRRTHDENLLRMATLTFDRMALGGMYDQVGGGFHRYATDPKWLVPHFEKMLYDNALLADAYIDAWQTTGRPLYLKVVRETLDWVLREMTSPSGAFYSTLDADSEGEEGLFYVWRPEEVSSLLGATEAPLVGEYFGITARGNFERGASIPNVEVPLEQFAEHKEIEPQQLSARIESARRRMLEARGRRVRPHLDDKILTAWNGMMIGAMARAARALDAPAYLDAATRAAEFLLKNLRGPDGLMRVSYRDGQLHSEGFLDDQAFFLHGLMALHEATGDGRWLKEAVALAGATDKAFQDPSAGGYFFTKPDRADLIIRSKHPTDGAIPSGNSMMALSFLAIHRATGEAAWLRRAEAVFTAFHGAIADMPGAFHNMLIAVDLASNGSRPAGAARQAFDVTTRLDPASATPGSGLDLEVVLKVEPGWHVNSAQPSLPYLIPTSVGLDIAGPVAIDRIDYPEGKLSSMGFAGKPISVYEGTQKIRLKLTLSHDAQPGQVKVAGWVISQACNDEACQLPSRRSFEAPLTVLPGPR